MEREGCSDLCFKLETSCFQKAVVEQSLKIKERKLDGVKSLKLTGGCWLKKQTEGFLEQKSVLPSLRLG